MKDIIIQFLFSVSIPTAPVLVNLSQVDISSWLLMPEMIIMMFLCAGSFHFWSSKRKKRNYSQLQRDKRCKLSIPLVINTPVTQEFSVKTFNISLSGAFLGYEDLKNSMSFTSLIGKRNGIKAGDLIDIRVYTGRFSQFSCQARVVRYNLEPGTLPPPGIAIEFVNMTHKNKKILKNLIEKETLPQAS